jgi:diacylglycerol kinase family enzyme
VASSFSVTPARPVPVFVNAGGGTAARLGAALKDNVRAAFEEAGMAVDVFCLPGAEIAEAVCAVDAPLVAVGGGDGTLGAAAGVLAGTGRTMVILPLGTRNHLARELGIPASLAGAAKVAAGGVERQIDLGSAGGTVFINNCSVGLYPRLVHARERVPLGLPKWLATIPALFTTLRGLRSEHFRLEWNGAEHRVETPLLFIGNNRYALDAGHLGRRESLSDGTLSLAAVHPPHRRSLAWTALKLGLGRADPETDFAAMADMAELRIYGHRVRHVALDGELVQLKFPLWVKVLPGALRVRVPDLSSGD